MKRFLGRTFIVLSLLGLSGCNLTIRGDDAVPVSPWPLSSSTSSDSLCLLFSKVTTYNGEEKEDTGTLEYDLDKILEATKTSGLFGQVFVGPRDPSCRILEFHEGIRKETNGTWFSLSFVTFFVLPFRVTEHLTLRTVVRASDGAKLGELENSGIRWKWWGWLVAASLPYRLVYHPSDLLYDLARANIIDAHSRGWL